MQEKIKSEGKCLFCGKTFAKSGINRHLATHLKEKSKTGKSGKSFLVKVETKKKWGKTPYFLSLWIDGEATMDSFDKFLRDIWLECCGHTSAFRDTKNNRSFAEEFNMMEESDDMPDNGDEEEYDWLTGGCDDDIPMENKVRDVFYEGLELDYEYDFGSTTALTIAVLYQYPVKADKKIVLLSRNEPLQIVCAICGKKPATQICTVCMYDGMAEFCDKCAEKHAKECEDFADYASMPVVNSPRMGVCAYDGGTIDRERDGIYKQ